MQNLNVGRLEIITGPMFSGKTTELLRRLSIYSIAGFKCLYVNSSWDTRNEKPFSSHNPMSSKGVPEFIDTSKVTFLSEIKSVKEYNVIGIDEAQFFIDLKKEVEDFVNEKQKVVIVAGLSSNAEQTKFGNILDLEPISDTYDKLSAVCCLCKKGTLTAAPFTRKKNFGKTTLNAEIGGSETYISVCRNHLYVEPVKFNVEIGTDCFFHAQGC